MRDILHEFIHLLIHTISDLITILPFLFIAFFIIELFEHKLSKSNKEILKKSKKGGPLIGGLLGIIPQCGFSVLATNLYVTRIITLGTLISIYLSTSDEMLIILLTSNASISSILLIVLTKLLIGIIFGYIIDLVLFRKKNKEVEEIDFSICEHDNCECHENIILSTLKHTLRTFLFIFIITFILNILFEYLDTNLIEKIFMKNSFISPFITSLIGLIPNCASSVILTELYLNNVIDFASTISGLLSGCGVALLFLFKLNKNYKENLLILGMLYSIGVISGLIIKIICLVF